MIILHVDDDSEDSEFFCEALREIDASTQFRTASNGREALKSLNSSTDLPDYIFLDINMPLMDGKTCLAEMKKNNRFKNIPVIMYSTTSDTNEIRECYKLGASDFLIKPNDFNKLCEDLVSIFTQLKREIRSL
jgi:CheY-like chemotaxis protein